ncbi:MAG: GatB/YqeY domain-containing protein [Wenzhouxiangellaceae bacterium]
MSLKQELQEAVKSAMRSGDKSRLTTLRMVMAAIKQREVDERIELDDQAVLAVVEKMIKQRRDAESQYRDAGRDDLAAQEAAEIDILSEFMPEQLSAAEVEQLIEQAIADTGASSAGDMGKVMGALKEPLKGRADMRAVSAQVRQRLTTT